METKSGKLMGQETEQSRLVWIAVEAALDAIAVDTEQKKIAMNAALEALAIRSAVNAIRKYYGATKNSEAMR